MWGRRLQAEAFRVGIRIAFESQPTVTSSSVSEMPKRRGLRNGLSPEVANPPRASPSPEKAASLLPGRLMLLSTGDGNLGDCHTRKGNVD